MSLSFTDLIASIRPAETDALAVSAPEDWMQGRTLYGGLSAALCHEAVIRKHDALPPLRSAQVAFIGPAGGDVTMRAEILRRGRSVTFVGADLHGEKGLATRTIFCFGEGRPSAFDRTFIGAPDVPLPEDCGPFFHEQFAPGFARQFENRLARGARPVSGSDIHDQFVWVRHKDEAAKGMPAFLAIADMLPPAMLPMFKEFAPISSMTWLINFLVDDPRTEDGWWLLEARAEHAREGYSSQDMFIWNRAGEAVATGRQSVAIFA